MVLGIMVLLGLGLLTIAVYAGEENEGLAYMSGMLAIGFAPIGSILGGSGATLLWARWLRQRSRPSRMDVALAALSVGLVLLWVGEFTGLAPWQSLGTLASRR